MATQNLKIIFTICGIYLICATGILQDLQATLERFSSYPTMKLNTYIYTFRFKYFNFT